MTASPQRTGPQAPGEGGQGSEPNVSKGAGGCRCCLLLLLLLTVTPSSAVQESAVQAPADPSDLAALVLLEGATQPVRCSLSR